MLVYLAIWTHSLIPKHPPRKGLYVSKRGINSKSADNFLTPRAQILQTFLPFLPPSTSYQQKANNSKSGMKQSIHCSPQSMERAISTRTKPVQKTPVLFSGGTQRAHRKSAANPTVNNKSSLQHMRLGPVLCDAVFNSTTDGQRARGSNLGSSHHTSVFRHVMLVKQVRSSATPEFYC